MDYFNYRNDALYAEDVAIEDIVSEHGTPCYVYSRATFERHWRVFDQAFGSHPHLICYAVKACSNIAILNVLTKMGSGFDIVSQGELERVLVAGGDPNKIIFSGVGKTETEILAALKEDIRCFNVEVAGEIKRINALAADLGKIANISIRVNPDVDAHTHPYISTGLKNNKFGIEIGQAYHEYKQAQQLEHINIVGINYHIGSQLTKIDPFLDALDKVLALVDKLAETGIAISHLDMGGGLGICYQDEQPPTPDEYVNAMLTHLGDRDIEVLLEPGRAIAGNAGILVTQLEYLKPTGNKNFAIVDAAINDLMRPALYKAWQDIVPVNRASRVESQQWDIVGPVCETGDFLGKHRTLKIEQGDLLAVRSSGAYGFSMSSNYNSRPRAAEIMVDGEQIELIRERESIVSLWATERLID